MRFALCDLRRLQNVPQIKLMDGNEVFHRNRVFLYTQEPRAPEINNADAVHVLHHFADTVIFRAGAVIHQVSELDIIIRPPVVGMNHRQTVKAI